MRCITTSLPKSGTHLLTRLLSLLDMKESSLHLSSSLLYTQTRNPIQNIRNYLRSSSKKDLMGISVDIDNIDNKIKPGVLKKLINDVPENHYVQAHLPYSNDLHLLLHEKNYKILAIVRDPRDVIISFINQQENDKAYPLHKLFNSISIEEKVDIVFNGIKISRDIQLSPLETRYKNVLGWKKKQKSLFLKFEDLIGEKGDGSAKKQKHTINKVLQYLNLERSNQEISSIRDKLFYRKAETFNKGQIGRWKTELNDQVIDLIKHKLNNSVLGEYLVELNYNLK
jgi:hypothetical protein